MSKENLKKFTHRFYPSTLERLQKKLDVNVNQGLRFMIDTFLEDDVIVFVDAGSRRPEGGRDVLVKYVDGDQIICRAGSYNGLTSHYHFATSDPVSTVLKWAYLPHPVNIPGGEDVQP